MRQFLAGLFFTLAIEAEGASFKANVRYIVGHGLHGGIGHGVLTVFLPIAFGITVYVLIREMHKVKKPEMVGVGAIVALLLSVLFHVDELASIGD